MSYKEMNKEARLLRMQLREWSILVLPVLIAASVVVAFAPPLWMGVTITSLCAFVPVAVRLHGALRTLRTQAAQHLEFTRHVIDVIPQPVYVKDMDSRYLVVNRAFADELDLTHEQIVGRTTAEIARSAQDAQRSREEDLTVLRGRTIFEERHDRHPNGGERHRLIMKGSCFDVDGGSVLVGANFDLSNWWITEQTLQSTLQREREHHRDTLAFVQRVIDLIPHPVYVKDATSRYLMVNQAMVREKGLPSGNLLGRMGLSPEATAELMRQHFEEDGAVLAGDSVFREVHEIDADSGKESFRIISKGSCLDANGEQVIVGAHVDVTELRGAERSLKQSLENEVVLRERTQAFIQRLIDVIPDPVFIKKAGGHYQMVNEAFAKYRNVDKLTFKRFDLNAVSADPDNRQLTASEDEQVLAGAEIDKEDHTVRQSTGEEIFRIICKRRSIYVDGDPVVVGIEHHITRWRIAERELKAVLEREMAQRLRTERFVQDLIDVIPDPVYIKGADGNYLIVNDAFARLLQQPRQNLIGLTAKELAADPESAATSALEDKLVIEGKEILKEQHSQLPVTGEECFRIVCKRRCVSVDGAPVVVGIDHYITEWRLAERELKRLAEEDALTGIANRRHFNLEAQRSISQALRHGQELSLVLFDIDHFKHINDTYGHNVGDEVLREVASRMHDCFRKSDLPGRWGGEEFIALLPHTSLEAATQVAERLRARLADQPFATSAGDIAVTLSGGGTQLLKADTLESLVARADAALYRAKSNGRNRIEVSQLGTDYAEA
ncbi:MAG TPA: diguanylate cyclase [Rhodocyclaceae bacterium]|nr:diguanylate cyclase [Rhodocyclaceae bacterium]